MAAQTQWMQDALKKAQPTVKRILKKMAKQQMRRAIEHGHMIPDISKHVKHHASAPASGEVTVYVVPMGKPRMTQRDQFIERDCTTRYWAYAATIRSQVSVPRDCTELSFTAYFPMPDSWTAKKKAAMQGTYHHDKPDIDNVAKAILDSLFENDSVIAVSHQAKLWDDGSGPRIVIKWS